MKNRKIAGIVAVIAICLSLLLPCATAFADEEANNEESGEASEQVEASDVANTNSTVAALEHEDVLDFGLLEEKGRIYSSDLHLKNNTDRNAIYRLTLLSLDDDALANDYKEASDWLTFVGGKNVFILAPGEEKTVVVRVTLPVELKSGSYYARIRITSVSESEADFNYVDLNTKHDGIDDLVTVRVNVAGDDFVYGGKLESSKINPFASNGKINGVALVKNEGTAGFEASYQLSAKPLFGGEEKLVASSKAEVYPGSERSFTREDEEFEGLFGIFTVTQTVSYVNAEGRIVNSKASRLVFSLKTLWICILGGAVIAIAAIVAIMKSMGGSKKGKKSSRDDDLKHSFDDEL